MLDVMFTAIFIGAGLVALAVLTSVIAFRFGAPLLLVFLVLGLFVGEDGLGIRFDDASLAYMIGSLALAVILFDSGFGTRFAAFRLAAAPAVTLATVGVALTAGITGLAAHYVIGFPLLQALLIGAIISSTDAAAAIATGVVMAPMVHSVEPFFEHHGKSDSRGDANAAAFRHERPDYPERPDRRPPAPSRPSPRA